MRTRLGLKVLGLSALVMGVMAIGTAGVAQAEAGACWGYMNAKSELKCFGEKVGEFPLEAGVKFKLQEKVGEVIKENTGTLLIEGLNFEVLCTAGSIINGGKLTSNGSITLGQVKFTGCIGLQRTPTLTKLAACTPTDPVGGVGTIITEKATGLIVLHENPTTKVKEPTVLLNDDPETPNPDKDVLARIILSEECAVGSELIVTGELVISDVGGKAGFETHALTHTSAEFANLQLMKVGGKKATIDGEGIFSLDTPHNELKWGGKAA